MASIFTADKIGRMLCIMYTDDEPMALHRLIVVALLYYELLCISEIEKHFREKILDWTFQKT